MGPHHWGGTRGAIPVGLNNPTGEAGLKGLTREATPKVAHLATPVGHTVGAGPEGLDRRITPERPQWRVVTGGAVPEDRTGRSSLLFTRSPCEVFVSK